jgi:NADPH:quinone reductase-like Zn-dependent oxidoreductase
VTATVRREDLREGVAEFGAEVVAPEGFEARGPFNVILELVGAPNLPANVKALTSLGRIVVIGISAGAKAELNLGALMGNRGRVMASMLRARPLEEKAIAMRGVERNVLPLIESGAVKVPVHATFPLERAAEAYESFTTGGKLGKIVIEFDQNG